MTDLSFNANFNFNANISLGNARPQEGAAVQLATNVVGAYLAPLAASAFAFAALPMLLAVRGGTQQPSGNGQSQFTPTPGAEWTASMQGENKADIDLGDGYTLQLDERNSEMVIHDANTGETTKIWGDPHVDVNGEHKFDFWGTTTFTLGNGTKLTINTEQFAGNPNMYVASGVTITKGNQAIQVEGLSQNKLGDLSVSMSNNGYALDSATRDGFVLEQGANGWESQLTGEVATQADLNLTKPGQLYGPDSSMPSLGEISSALSTFLFFGFVGEMIEAGSEFRAAAEAKPLLLNA
ncbi:DUF1521 domain-containing protein [Sphingomonas sp. MMS12-HWE2-04]|uniref:DUF1521 domain-containing protein n=1 Tax=Sphingomonas sp. MMS12-HWE2-04 TaxID=3234199 RepID=UPI00384FAAB3